MKRASSFGTVLRKCFRLFGNPCKALLGKTGFCLAFFAKSFILYVCIDGYSFMISVEEDVVTVLLFSWVILVVMIVTKKLYEWMRERDIAHNVAVYYNRKFIHMFAGGLCAVVVPFVFKTIFFPLVMAMLLEVFIYFPVGWAR